MEQKKPARKEWVPIKEIKSADRATAVAVDFLKRYYSYIKPIRANKANNIWIVELDVGLLLKEIAKVHIDANTGFIVEYDVPKGEVPGGQK